ncbi:hypothetical protein CD29_09475 [Ureibacillus manganicus DSM 26584]|uniref:Uncharacterized protein n=1 Tax=Ureibacillus manganicus DSM 26584 TaxID=1384049 RepID=A0A0A3I2F9_9BACL|nr:hypothetical protein CD29_09475 [Ureibacillus manganicus DSM 26584]
MDRKNLRNMRLKQTAVLNGLLLFVMILYFLITNFFIISFSQFFLVLGILVLIQGVFGLVKGDSTKSIFPILEKVAIYEKQKMGKEWYKQRKVSYIWSLVLSCILFLQSFTNRGYTGNVVQLDFKLMIIMTFVFLTMLNISLMIHNRKVDRSVSELDMKGYTWKSNIIAVAIGIVFAFVMIFFTIFYIMSGI